MDATNAEVAALTPLMVRRDDGNQQLEEKQQQGRIEDAEEGRMNSLGPERSGGGTGTDTDARTTQSQLNKEPRIVLFALFRPSMYPQNNSAVTNTHTHGIDIPAIPPPPLDGGLQAWSQVLVGHLIFFSTWGYMNSFGIFQAYYVQTLQRTQSEISWIVSTQFFLLAFVGTFSGRAMDAGYLRSLLISGFVLQLLGVFTTSVSETRYWRLFVAQGVCSGIGMGLLFCPTVALVATYFGPRKRALAMALVQSGNSVGGTVFPAVAQRLLPTVGFGWMVRVMGFLILFCFVVVLMLARTRVPPRETGPLVELAAFKEAPYTLFTVGAFLISWALYFTTFYINSFAKDIIHVSSTTALTFLFVFNSLGIPGRIISSLVTDRYLGPLNTIIPLSFASGVLLFCWIAVKDLGGLIAFIIVYGLIASATQGLMTTALPSLTSDYKKLGVRTGMILSILAVSFMTGAPLAGALIRLHHGSYLYAQIWGGVCLIIGSLFVLAARVAGVGWHFGNKM